MILDFWMILDFLIIKDKFIFLHFFTLKKDKVFTFIQLFILKTL
jgi:hypothetical protein